MTGTADTLSVPGGHADADALERYHRDEVAGCTRCGLSATRTCVVVGNGDPRARLMLVGEAPGYHEDRQAVPFCGAAGRLLDEMLEGIGLTRADVFVTNVLKCRPPGNRDPLPAEISACEPHLYRQIRLIRPEIICSLGNFATKLLSGRPDGISRVHGCELPIQVAGVPVLLYPILHPAAALYTPAMKALLRDDFARIPALLAGMPARPAASPGPTRAEPPVAPAPPEPASARTAPATTPPTTVDDLQLGLF